MERDRSYVELAQKRLLTAEAKESQRSDEDEDWGDLGKADDEDWAA